ncbi:hypothetical protein R6Q59_010883 [Mikania micrantha]
MEENGAKDWRETVKKMLPPGTALPEESDDLDYSIALEYMGPDVSYELPRVGTIRCKLPFDPNRICSRVISPVQEDPSLVMARLPQ